MRRLNKNDRVRVASHAQRPQACSRGRTAHAPLRLPPPRARLDRHPCRLRARHLRRLHRADRRARHALLPDARGPGRRPRGQNRGIACRARRRAQSAANGVPRPSRAAMRLLHAGHLDVVHRLPRPQSAPDAPPKSAKCSPATSAAAPAMRASSKRWRTWRLILPPPLMRMAIEFGPVSRISGAARSGAPLIRDRRRLGVCNDPGSAAHHFVLRCARETEPC